MRGTAPPSHSQAQTLIAELTGSDTCTTAGISVTAYAPVLVLCRSLIAAGMSPDQAMECWRGPTLCLRNLAKRGFVATTNIGGAEKWHADMNKYFAGKKVFILADNDEVGARHAADVARHLCPVAESVRVVNLPGLPEKGDVSDWLVNGGDPGGLVELCEAEPVVESPDQITAVPAPDDHSEPTASLLPFVNLADWQDRDPPEREWVVRDRVPARNLTLLSGEGGIGKTMLGLHLCAAVALGRDWLKTMPACGSSLVICCEDDEDELHRRIKTILDHYNASFSDVKATLSVASLAGRDAVMAAPDRSGIIQPTKLFHELRSAIGDQRPKLVMLDNSADIYAGNENDRSQVRQFITMLRGLTTEFDATVLLTSHPSLTGISSGTGLSGSTAWNASVRSRLYFKRATTEKGDEPDPDLRVLEVMKANYGPVGEAVPLRWENGLFLPVAGVASLDRMAAEQAADDLFLKLVRTFEDQGRNVSEKPTAPNYAPTMFAKDPSSKSLSNARRSLDAAMNRLFAASKIRVEQYGKPSRPASRLVVAGRCA